MLLRLFKPVRHRQRGAFVAGAFLVAGCGGAKFVASDVPAGASGAGHAGGATDSAGSSGVGADDSAGEGGTSSGGVSGGGTSSGGANAGTTSNAGGSGGSGGSGGKVSTSCDCAAGSYCQEGTKTCHLCSDFSALDFASPEKLATLSQTGNQRFPRPASAGSDLFYRSGDDGKPALWYAPTPISGVGRALFVVSGIDSGPLFAPEFPPDNFYFDRVNPLTKLREIMSATWAAGAPPLPAKLSDPAAATQLNGGNDDFSVAIAAKPKRVYWMSSRNKLPAPELIWTTFGPDATMPAVLDVQVKAGKGECPRLGNDATPWVNADGSLLLFRSESVNDNCAPNDSGAYDLFAAPLSGDGIPMAPAVALSALNNTGGGSTETDPALSADSCTIYFASDNGKGDFDLYSAARN
ncbi:MAG: hypothetical protein ABI548_15010 [Polyangiaceae bacterium]